MRRPCLRYLAFGEKNDANRIYPLNVASERYPEGAPHLINKSQYDIISTADAVLGLGISLRLLHKIVYGTYDRYYLQ